MKHLLLTVLILPVFAFGQVNVLNAKTPEQIGVMTDEEVDLNNNSPLPYAYVNERDVLFSKTIWEVIVDGLLNNCLIISSIAFGLLILWIHNRFEKNIHTV